jgi:hypothetical protein
MGFMIASVANVGPNGKREDRVEMTQRQGAGIGIDRTTVTPGASGDRIEDRWHPDSRLK